MFKFAVALCLVGLCHGLGTLVKSIDFTPAYQQLAVDTHNKWRREAGASNMLEMKWNPQLAAMAKEWANYCAGGHRLGDPKNKPDKIHNYAGFSYVGEGLSAGQINGEVTSPDDAMIKKYIADGINSFVTATGEKSSFKYPEAEFSHYTQVVWAASGEVGCALAFCTKDDRFKLGPKGNSYQLACNYGPGGNIPIDAKKNYRMVHPFDKGTACSACPAGTKCKNGLCAK